MPVIKLYASFRKSAGIRELWVDGESIGEILANLVIQLPVLKPALMDDVNVKKFVTIAVNGHNTDLIDGLNTPVTPDDIIAIFPPLAGG